MKFRAYTVIRFTTEVEVEAANADEAIRKVKAMDGRRLVDEGADGPEVEVEDVVSVTGANRKLR